MLLSQESARQTETNRDRETRTKRRKRSVGPEQIADGDVRWILSAVVQLCEDLY